MYKYLFILLLAATSCSPKIYYQYYEMESEATVDNVFENEDLIITCNFWKNQGQTQFTIKNKTKRNIFIDLTGSFIDINGVANQYYDGILTKDANCDNANVCFNQRNYLHIPPGTGKQTLSFKIREYVYHDCDIYFYPKKHQDRNKFFDSKNSPLYLTNVLRYNFEHSEIKDAKEIKIKYYTKEISNYRSSEFVKSLNKSYCNEELAETEPVEMFKKPEAFYIKYQKNLTWWPFKH